MGSQWSEWKNLEKLSKKVGRETFVGVPRKPGVYEIRWVENGKPREIPRLNGIDKNGIIYIGRGKNLKFRIREFWRALKEEEKSGDEKVPHSGGNTYSFFKFGKVIKRKDLEVRWQVLNSEKEAKDAERCLIYKYVRQYFDRPLLNLNAHRWGSETKCRKYWL